MTQGLVSINIVSFNDEKTIEKAVASAIHQTYSDLEILIIDNASSDNTPRIIEEKLLSWQIQKPIRFIKNGRNIGFARGHNQAIRESHGDLILCLNSDLILAPDFIAQSIGHFKNEQVAAIQGKLLKFDFEKNNVKKDLATGQSLIDTTGLVMLKNRRVINRGQGELDHGQCERSEEIFGADGATPIYRRTALKDAKLEINGRNEYFDEDFFCYKEDVDLAWRLRLLGWKTIYEPKSSGFHGREAGEKAVLSSWRIIHERQKLSPFAKYYSFKNQRLMQIKNELPALFFSHMPFWLPKEIAAWLYFLFFESNRFRLIKELISQIPSALKKRSLIMKKRRVDSKTMNLWFK